ncbi:hypothetical protein D3C73_1050840 [compost metagenome]
MRNTRERRRAAHPSRNRVVPAAPSRGNNDLASEAPRVIDSMASRTASREERAGLFGCILFKPELDRCKKIYLEAAVISV